MQVEGSVFLITGASSGIGAATAEAASAAGAKVVLAARRHDRITELADRFPDALAVRCDVTDAEQVADVVERAVQAYGRVDVLVNNAGQGLHTPVEQVRADDFRAILDLNVVAPLVAMQAVLPVMRAQGAGSIVNVSSGTTMMVLPGAAAYAASKAALNMLSSVARLEFAALGVVVSTVYPFITATEFHSSLRAGGLPPAAGPQDGRPRMQPQTPGEVADVILDLVRTGDEKADLVPRQLGGSY